MKQEGDRIVPDDRSAIRIELERLTTLYDPAAVFAALRAFLKGKKWTPGCNKERTYSYVHAVEVEKCPISDEAQQKLESDAQDLAEKQANAYCARNADGCTHCKILDSAPSSSGCNCVSMPIGKDKCVYTCTWTVKYICEKEAQ